ncbi:MAG TPA: prephenate dehydrogenase/arogenate dehydrogenase family protein, partial [Dongiaceae bacterium]
MTTTAPIHFNKVCLIGIGLIGSSMAQAMRGRQLVKSIAIYDIDPEARAAAAELKLGDQICATLAEAVTDADLTVVCVPAGAVADVAPELAKYLKPGSILSDVGSVKQAVVRDLGPHVPDKVHFIPGHPIAGTEHSGPRAGFAELFQGRWCILTPLPGTDTKAIEKLQHLWESMGSQVELMESGHHDQVLAITSHLPHLIAYTIVGTATGLEESTQSEVIKFSASGFRDFTRIAASDPIM